MPRNIKILGILLIAVTFLLILSMTALAVLKYKARHYERKLTQEETLLKKEATRMLSHLKKGDDASVFKMFNSTFVREIELAKFQSTMNLWRNGRTIKRIRITNIMTMGRGGHITSWVTFDNNQKSFLYQSWIKTSQGWRLLWFNKVLPQSLAYGISDDKEIQKIKQMTIEELFNNQAIVRIIGNLKIPDTIMVVATSENKKLNFQLTNHTILELPEDIIKAHTLRARSLFYIEFATIRILDDIATCFVDIHPFYKDLPKLNRTRGMLLYFTKQKNQWVFDSQGTKW
jgi:hypothetical protein